MIGGFNSEFYFKGVIILYKKLFKEKEMVL